MDILNFDNPAAQAHSVTIYQVQYSECVHCTFYAVCMMKHLRSSSDHMVINSGDGRGGLSGIPLPKVARQSH